MENISKLSALLKELAENLATVQLPNGNGKANGKIKPITREFEETKPLFASPKFTAAFPLPVVHRFQQAGNRYYFTLGEDSVQFYPSVTSIINNTHPTSYGIKKLIGDKGLDGFYQYMQEKADYGTLLHILITEYLASGNNKEERTFNFDTIEEKLLAFAEENKTKYPTEWVWNLKKDTAALIQFCIDYEVDPLLVETVVTCQNNGRPYAGAIDLLAEVTIEEKGFWGEVYKSGEKKGEPKETKRQVRKIALIDFKSGKSGFFPEHATQLHMYARALKESVGVEPQVLLNVAPKDWTIAPNYDVKDQTQTVNPDKIEHIVKLFYLDWNAPKDVIVIDGKLNGINLSENVRIVSAEKYILNKFKRAQNETQSNLF